MLRLSFGDSRKPLRILCLGAHSDDIEIGCGGTLLRILQEFRNVHVHWVVFSARGARHSEALRSAGLFLKGAKTKKVVVRSYRDSFFPYQGAKIKSEFERLKAANHDVIFSHYRDDLHQDHRIVNELTWNTFRNHVILEYEIPKYDGDLGSPNFFVELGEATCRAKIRYLQEAFASQRGKHWFSDELFWGLMRIRGMEAHSSTRFAEAFYTRKLSF